MHKLLDFELTLESASILVHSHISDSVDLLVVEGAKILSKVHSFEPFSEAHLVNGSLILHDAFVVIEGLISAVSVPQEMSLKFGHGDLELRKSLAESVSHLLLRGEELHEECL